MYWYMTWAFTANSSPMDLFYTLLYNKSCIHYSGIEMKLILGDQKPRRSTVLRDQIFGMI